MFSNHVLVVQTVLIVETVIRPSDTMASPAQLILHYRCPNTCCVHEDTGTGAVIFPSDTKNLSETTLAEFHQDIQMTSICNPRLAHVRYRVVYVTMQLLHQETASLLLHAHSNTVINGLFAKGIRTINITVR